MSGGEYDLKRPKKSDGPSMSSSVLNNGGGGTHSTSPIKGERRAPTPTLSSS